MPQLVKGGKYVFGWSVVSPEGCIVIPPETFEEYGFSEQTRAIVFSGSKTSGGFVLVLPDVLQSSQLSPILKRCPELSDYRLPQGQTVHCGTKVCCWVTLRDNRFLLPESTLTQYGVTFEDCVLVVRGSGLGPSFIVRGRIVEEARQHPEIDVFS